MKYLCALIFGLFPTLLALAQTPNGRLYFTTWNNLPPSAPIFGYVEYPSEEVHIIDTVTFGNDMVVDSSGIYLVQTNVLKYDLAGQFIDTLHVANAQKGEVWGDQLILLMEHAPFVRFYDKNTLQFSHAIDTAMLPFAPADLTVLDDQLFILQFGSVRMYDLVNQDTLGVVPNPPTDVPFQNIMITSGEDGNIYYASDWATAVPRGDLLRLDPVNATADSIGHLAFNLLYNDFVVGNDQVYYSDYPTRFDTNTDTFHEIGSDSLMTIGYDAESSAIFTFSLLSGSRNIYYDINGVRSNPVAFPNNLLRARFVKASDISVGVEEPASELALNVFPNPVSAGNQITLEGTGEIHQVKITDALGREVFQLRPSQQPLPVQVQLPAIANGTYLLTVNAKQGQFSTALVIK